MDDIRFPTEVEQLRYELEQARKYQNLFCRQRDKAYRLAARMILTPFFVGVVIAYFLFSGDMVCP